MEFKPIAPSSRIEAVDGLRGFALFGVLLANLPMDMGGAEMSSSDSLMIFLFHLLLDNKFIAIFSLLFGFGFSVQLKRAAAKQVNFVRYFMIRMLLLFLIGSLHAYILWNGDILRAYALGGVFLLLIRHWSIKRLLITALSLNVLATGAVYIGNAALGWQIYDYDYALATEQMFTPSYWRYLIISFITDPWTNFLKDLPITLSFAIGNMLMGFVLERIDFFRLPIPLKKLTTWLILLGGSLGFGASFVYHQVLTGAIELNLSLFWLPFVLVAGMILQSLFYVSLFLRLFQSGSFQRLFRWFVVIGRTALSNYVFQSVFFLIVFYHCIPPFQLYGKISMAATYLLGFLFFGLQIIASSWWLRTHKQGPLEYVWKKLSYRVAQSTDRLSKTFT